MTRVLHLQAFGLKGADLQLDLSAPVVALLGPNGAGKTTAIQALQLLATGGLGEGAKASDRVMRLAREDRIEVVGVVDVGGPKPVEVRRRWVRGRDGKVSKKVSVSTLPYNAATPQAEAAIAELLGAAPEAWSPEALLGLSPEKLRERLSRLLPQSTGVERAVDGLPLPGQPADVRVRRAIEDVREVLAAKQGEARALRSEIEGLGYVPSPPPAPLALLEALRAEEFRARRWAELVAEREALEASLGGLSELVAGDLLELLEARAGLEARASELRAEQVRLRADAGGLVADPSLADVDPDAAAEEAAYVQREADAAAARAATLRHAGETWAAELACPHCGSAIEAAAVRAELGRLIEQASAEATALAEVASELAATRDRVAQAARAHRAGARLAEIAEELEGFDAALLELPGEADLRGRLDKTDQAQRLQALAVTLSGEAPRALAEVQADIARALGEVEEAARRKAEHQRAAELASNLEAAERWAEKLKAKLAELATLEGSLLQGRAEELERRLSEVVGARVTVETAPECRISIGGVPLVRGVVSDGEWVRAATALVRVVGSVSGARWRPLVVDRLEAVSVDRREAFLASLVAAVEAGDVDQVIVAGCPDTPLGAIDGMRVIQVGAADGGELIPFVDVDAAEMGLRKAGGS